MHTIQILGSTLLPLLGLSAGLEECPRSQGDPELVITILFDNYATHDRFRSGWGFSALLETGGHTVLFDTGADGQALLENMRLLDKDPMDVEAVVISHAHGDHTGGLQALLDQGVRPRLHLLRAFPADLWERAAQKTDVIRTPPGGEIVPGIRTTGRMGTEIPEQALLLDTREGIVVLTGCAHPGVVSMAERAGELADAPLHAVLGGFHLMREGPEAIQDVLQAFRRLGVRQAGPTHCSGDEAMAAFRQAYGQAYLSLGVGRVLRFARTGG